MRGGGSALPSTESRPAATSRTAAPIEENPAELETLDEDPEMTPEETEEAPPPDSTEPPPPTKDPS